MPYMIKEKKGIINSLKRKLVKKELYNLYAIFLYMPTCVIGKCNKCPILEKDCRSHLKRRSESALWFKKHGYYIDDSKVLHKILLNKKYIFIGHKINDILHNFFEEDCERMLLLTRFKKNEKVYFKLTENHENYIDIISYNKKTNKCIISEKELLESIFTLFSEDDTYSQETFDV